MTSRASGTFEVRVKPILADEKVDGLTVGRMAVDKQFVGDLEGTSRGEMMTAEANSMARAATSRLSVSRGRCAAAREPSSFCIKGP